MAGAWLRCKIILEWMNGDDWNNSFHQFICACQMHKFKEHKCGSIFWNDVYRHYSGLIFWNAALFKTVQCISVYQAKFCYIECNHWKISRKGNHVHVFGNILEDWIFNEEFSTCMHVKTSFRGCIVEWKTQEKCADLIDFAAAELRDVRDGYHSSMTCPVLSALAKADRGKAVPGRPFVIYFFVFGEIIHVF